MLETNFEVNMESYLSQHEIIYRSAAKGWENGLPLGNGDLAALAYSEGEDYVLGITKVDVWDKRFKREKALSPFSKFLELIEKKDWKELIQLHKEENTPYVKDPFPTPKPCGKLRIKKSILTEDKEYEERLSLYKGMLSSKGKWGNIFSFVDANSNLLTVKCTSKKDRKITIELNRWVDKNLGEPELGNDGKYFWVDYAFPDEFRYVMMGRLKDEYTIERRGNSIFLFIDSGEAEIYLSVATSLESDDPFKKARKIIDSGLLKGYEELLSQHKQWWHSFWQKSLIDIEDKLLENLWYYSLYLLGSSSRGVYPTGLPSIWYMEDIYPWHGDFHTNLNIEMVYWPIFTSNHLELGKPFYKNFYEVLPKVKEETREGFGIEGAKYAFSSIPTGQEIAGGYWRYEIYVTAWIGQMFWWYYLYSQDEEFLEEKCYPVIKEILSFYKGYLKTDYSGKYYLFPCHPVEQTQVPLAEKNVLIDLALLKDILGAAISVSEILKRDERKRKEWKNVLDNLSSYPNNGEVFLEYEGAPPNLPVHHADMLSVVFPCGEIGIDSAKELYDLAKRTLETIPYHTIRREPFPPFPVLTWNDDCNWLWLAIAAARLGLGKLATAYLYDMGILFHLKNNGLFSVGFSTKNPREREMDGLVHTNSSTGFGMAINEMLLQSYDAKIRVFPAIPSDWKNCRFAKLRAVGAFLVSSKMIDGQIGYVLIKSLKGGDCVVINPWREEEVKIWDFQKKELLKVSKGKEIIFDSKEGKSYLIKMSKETFESLPLEIIKGEKRHHLREYIGPRYLAKVKEDKTWHVYLGKF